jgi:Planctomycete cytochrome C/EF hand
MKKFPLLLLSGTVAAALADPIDFGKLDLGKLPPPSTKSGLTFEHDIKPLFEASCIRCHGEEKQKGDIRLDSLAAVLKGGEDGKILVAGKSRESALVVAISGIDDESAMPPKRRGGGPGGPGGPGGRAGFGPGMFIAPQIVAQADKDGDKKVTKAEFTALADAWYDKLDTDKAGKLTAEQFASGLGEVLPPPQGFGPPRGNNAPQDGPRRGGFGPGRFIGPGFFSAADTDKDGSLTRAELKGTFAKWFTLWDAQKAGSVTEEQIRDGLNAALPAPSFGGPGGGRPGGQGAGPGGEHPENAPGGPGGFGGAPGGQGGPGGGTPAKALTPEEVGLVRAWIDQGAK